ncbi:MAG: hypothetical protein P9M14_03095 [Candidatus Alcyoniella australis]|nr:hypothetical protein [Candidatus Alcyoniella australis]
MPGMMMSLMTTFPIFALFQRNDGVLGCFNLIALKPECLANDQADVLLVVNNQHTAADLYLCRLIIYIWIYRVFYG